jgi:hypothetical protein
MHLLCLLHDVLQHYTDLKDLKRTIVNTHAIDLQVAACSSSNTHASDPQVAACTPAVRFASCTGIIACLAVGHGLNICLAAVSYHLQRTPSVAICLS